MKKILIIGLLCLICFLTVGCGPTPTGQLEKIENNEEYIIGPFECIAKFDKGAYETIGIDTVSFYKDTNTNLIYIFIKDSNDDASHGGFSIYYNTEGNPMTYDEWKEIYNVD